MSEETKGQRDTFASFGKTYQEKTLQAILVDHQFAEQMHEVLKPSFFDTIYLEKLAGHFYDYKQKYKTFPSPEILETIVTRDEDLDPAAVIQVKDYIQRIGKSPLNGDTAFVKESSLEFCKKQVLKEAFVKGIDMMESGKYDAIQSVIKDALNRGASYDLGHDYIDGLKKRGEKVERKPLSTGWPVLDSVFNGGWERGTLSTFIAPTGAGKSMFLVNCGAAGIAQGYNVVYVTCEMADWKIGIRFDSYFSGVEINKVSENTEKVEREVKNKVKGGLNIKEFPTKTATVQTIRAYLQRLYATKNFAPDLLVIDYADLLRSSAKYGDKRFELEGIYEELRALAQELNIVVITADQTNRAGLDLEIVTIGQIGESYAKATVCDVIMTVSRRMEDKQAGVGRLFLAKSRLGPDGQVFPFTMNTATVKATLLSVGQDPIELLLQSRQEAQRGLADRYAALKGNGKRATEEN